MAKIHGHGGSVKVNGASGDAIGNLQSWNVDAQATVTEGYSMGDAWSDNEATIKKWSGSAEAYFDPTDAGQISLEPGDVVPLHFYPGGDDTGQPYRSGTAVVTGTPLTASKDGWVSITFNFAGKGALVTGTAA
jgi:hypothetical protein